MKNMPPQQHAYKFTGLIIGPYGSVSPMQSSSALRVWQRGQSGSPHSFFCRQKWQQMPTRLSYRLPRPWLEQRT